MLDVVLLQLIKKRDNYDQFRPMIKDYLLDSHVQKIVKDFGAYFKDHSSHTEIDWDLFPTWWGIRHPNLKEADLKMYNKIFERVQKDPDEDSSKSLKQDLLTRDFATVMVNHGHDALDGRIAGEVFVEKVEDGLEAYYKNVGQYADVVYEDSDIFDLTNSTSYETGLKFSVDGLNDNCGSFHAGDLIGLAATPDAGKTSAVVHQFGSNVVEQVIDPNNKDKWFYDRPVLYFNNEGDAKKIRLYYLQALFGSTKQRILDNPDGVRQALEDKFKGKEYFRVVPCQGQNIKQLERIIKKENPCVVIYDMMDNVGGFENNGGTSDQRYRDLYDYVRQMGVKYNHTAVATSQANGEANGLERIEMHMLYGSRVAKQSTFDLLIMLGRSLAAEKQYRRYIYTPKNKMDAQPKYKRDGTENTNIDRFTNTEVFFNGDIRRLENPKGVG